MARADMSDLLSSLIPLIFRIATGSPGSRMGVGERECMSVGMVWLGASVAPCGRELAGVLGLVGMVSRVRVQM
jgi:hypothetical protein